MIYIYDADQDVLCETIAFPDALFVDEIAYPPR
jgi:hypothetical protein